MFDDGRPQLRHVVQRRKTLLAAVARLLHSAERQLNAAARAKRAELAANHDYVEQVLTDGAAKAQDLARKVLTRARYNCGLD